MGEGFSLIGRAGTARATGGGEGALRRAALTALHPPAPSKMASVANSTAARRGEVVVWLVVHAPIRHPRLVG